LEDTTKPGMKTDLRKPTRLRMLNARRAAMRMLMHNSSKRSHCWYARRCNFKGFLDADTIEDLAP